MGWGWLHIGRWEERMSDEDGERMCDRVWLERVCDGDVEWVSDGV